MHQTMLGGHVDYTILFVIAVGITILAFINWHFQTRKGELSGNQE
ncbi:hypothetical protein [Fructilactobacillus lindneri]|nr:hypothetical protein [Fructilactobacillus lindneri]